MTAEELRAHMNRMADTSVLVSLSELLVDHAVSCVDGRKEGGIVGAPGGNMGLFILMLAALEQFTARTLSDEDVADVFEEYLDEFGSFYLHTDDLSLDQLRAMLLEEERTRPYGDDLSAFGKPEDWVRHPPHEARADLIKLIIQPECTGCGHLRLMLEHPGEYHVRAGLLRNVLVLFFQHLWDGDDRLILDVLQGIHEEKAVVRVHVKRPENDGSKIVLAYPRYSDTDVFVYHPEASGYLLTENAAFLAGTGRIEKHEVDALAELQQELGGEQLDVTLGYLARDLPVFDATFDVTGSAVVCTDASRAG